MHRSAEGLGVRPVDRRGGRGAGPDRLGSETSGSIVCPSGSDAVAGVEPSTVLAVGVRAGSRTGPGTRTPVGLLQFTVAPLVLLAIVASRPPPRHDRG